MGTQLMIIAAGSSLVSAIPVTYSDGAVGTTFLLSQSVGFAIRHNSKRLNYSQGTLHQLCITGSVARHLLVLRKVSGISIKREPIGEEVQPPERYQPGLTGPSDAVAVNTNFSI